MKVWADKFCDRLLILQRSYRFLLQVSRQMHCWFQSFTCENKVVFQAYTQTFHSLHVALHDIRMYAVTRTHSLPSLSLELDPGTSGIGIDVLTFVRSATVFYSLSTGLKYRLRCSWYWELPSDCWQWRHRCLHLDRLFLPVVTPCKPFLFILCDNPAFYNFIYRYKQQKTRWKLSRQTCEFLQIYLAKHTVTHTTAGSANVCCHWRQLFRGRVKLETRRGI